MGLISGLQQMNQQGGGHGLLFNPLANAVQNGPFARGLANILQPPVNNTPTSYLNNPVRPAMPQRMPVGPTIQPIPQQPLTPTIIKPIPSPQNPPSTPQPIPNPNFQTYNSNVRGGKVPQRTINVPNELLSAATSAGQSTGLPPESILALAYAENQKLNNGAETSGIGQQAGRGYFQIDLSKHPEVTPAQANDPNFAANFAANKLLADFKYFSNLGIKNPVTAAYLAYNAGRQGITNVLQGNRPLNPITSAHQMRVRQFLTNY